RTSRCASESGSRRNDPAPSRVGVYMTRQLADATTMGAVTLRVADLDLMRRYYRDAVGLDELGDDSGLAVLGRNGVPIMVLEHAPELRHAGPNDAGLYHTAILFDSQAALAAA